MRIHLFGHYWQLGLVLLWVVEATGIFGSTWLAVWLFGAEAPTVVWTQSLVLAVCVMVAAISMGLFSQRLRDRTSGIVLRIGLSVSAGALVGAAMLYISPAHRLSLEVIFGFLAIGLFSLTIVRVIAHRLLDEDILKRRILVYGAGQNAGRIQQLRRRSDQRGFKVIGYVPSASDDRIIPSDRLLDANVRLS